MAGLAALLGIGVAAGILAVITGLQPAAGQHRRPARLRIRLPRQLAIRLAVAAFAAAVVGAWTRWPVGALLAGIAAYTLPAALGRDRHAAHALARTEAIATWAEMLRDNLSAAAGLEQAIIVTAPFTPEAIRDDIAELAVAVRLGQRLPVALRQLLERLDDPTGRLVVRALLQASQRQSRQLSELLSELAIRARARANLRMRIAPGHARIRTNARIITGFTLAMAVGLILLNPVFLKPYGTVVGQIVLLIVGAVFAAGFAGITRLARVGFTDESSQR